MDPPTLAIVLDVLVTASYLGAGALVARSRAGRQRGVLIGWVGLCWWWGGPLLGTPLIYWGALLHASAATRSGRLGSAPRIVAVVAAYVAAAGAGTIYTQASIAVVIGLGVLLAVPDPGPRRWFSLGTVAVVAASAAAHALTPATADPELLLVLEVVLCVMATLLVASTGSRVRSELVDAIVQFGPENPLDRLADLGATDEATRAARSAADRLVHANLALSDSLRARVAELEASRARLVTVEDQERSRLEGQLQRGPVARLDLVSERLATATSDRPSARQRLDRARGLALSAREDLLRIGGGLFPAALVDGGLEPALDAVTAHCPLPVCVDLRVDRLSPEVAAAVYYVCAEAVANAVKHSGASRIWVGVHDRADGWVEVEISDDGAGGADPDGGSGLHGLSTRAEVLGGTCTVTSRPGRATVVTALMPSGALT